MKPHSHLHSDPTSVLRSRNAGSFVLPHLPLLAALGLALGSLHAQNVPPFMNYQGRVTAAGGVGLGDAAPEARKVVFRLFAGTSGGSTLWTEEQTVTLSKGDFSVLLGLGIAFNAEPHDPLDTVFTGDRFLEITVDNGDGTINGSDTPITPRQRITSTAYSFRAKTADSVVGGSIGTTSLADTSVTLAKMASASVSSTAIVDGSIAAADLADGSVTLNKLAGNSVNSSKIVDATIATADLADASVTKAKLGTDVGIWDIASGNAYRSTGNVGIGVLSPLQKLHVAGQGIFAATAVGPDPGGAVGDAVHIGYTTAGYGYINAVNTGVGGRNLILQPGINGNVGIGVTSPASKLAVNCTTNQVGENNASFASPNIGPGVCFIHYGTLGDVYFRSANTTSGKVILQDQGGNVGIGTTVPAQKLDVVQATWPQLRLGLEPAAFAKRALNIGYHNSFGTDGGGAIMAEEQSNFFRDLYVSPYASGPNQGNVAIGQTTTPSHMLTVNGVCRSTQSSFATSSDARVKEHIAPLSGSLDRLMRLKPVTFDYIKAFQKCRSGLDHTQTGFIAQEVQQVFPDMVTQAAEKVGEQEIKDFRVLNTSSLTPHLVSAAQELARKVEALEKANAEKDTALTAMTQRLAALEARDKARDAKLAAIEAMLSGDKPAALPVSLKKSVGGAE